MLFYFGVEPEKRFNPSLLEEGGPNKPPPPRRQSVQKDPRRYRANLHMTSLMLMKRHKMYIYPSENNISEILKLFPKKACMVLWKRKWLTPMPTARGLKFRHYTILQGLFEAFHTFITTMLAMPGFLNSKVWDTCQIVSRGSQETLNIEIINCDGK